MKANKALIECDRMLIRVKMIDLMREKDGVSLFAIQSMDGARYVLKFFENETYRREIVHYQQLQSVGIPTIPLIANTEKSAFNGGLALQRYLATWQS